jgi:hypothetical protein
MTTPVPTNQTIPFYATLLNDQFPGKGVGKQYTALANAYPADTPYEVFQVLEENIVGQGLSKALRDAVIGVANATAESTVGAGASAVSVPNVAGQLGSAALSIPGLTPIPIASSLGGSGGGSGPDEWKSLLIRVAEFLIGAGIILVGLNKLLGGRPIEIVEKGAKTAGEGAAVVAAPEVALPALAAPKMGRAASAVSRHRKAVRSQTAKNTASGVKEAAKSTRSSAKTSGKEVNHVKRLTEQAARASSNGHRS